MHKCIKNNHLRNKGRIVTFHAEILLQSSTAIGDYKKVKSAKQKIDSSIKTQRYLAIKQEAQRMVLYQMTKMLNTPGLKGLIVSRKAI